MVQVKTAFSSIDFEADDKLGNTASQRITHLCDLNPELSSSKLLEMCGWTQIQLSQSALKDVDSQHALQVGFEMADMLAGLKLDENGIMAAVLYPSINKGLITLEQVNHQWGLSVAKLIEHVLKMSQISQALSPLSQKIMGSQSQIENVRKMLVDMVDDVRVPLIKLAERICAIRAAKHESNDVQCKLAREALEIYAPLAHRLGMGQLKWELEDLALRYLNPEAYQQIAKLLDERRLDRENYIDLVISETNKQLDAIGLKANISGRAKHIYSIWRKMQKKDLSFGQIYDVRAIRILVPEVRDCYAALGVVHSLYRHIPKEFDDYIANPKENGYRSLHTAVMGPDGKVFEVQIRTHDMHDEAELGICSHWRYKGTDNQTASGEYEKKLSWLRQVLDMQQELNDTQDPSLEMPIDLAPERIYVFTPQGHAIDLPKGATPLDFAYRIHTSLGHRCRGAKINQRIVPLNQPLQTGDQVEIINSKRERPSRDWLNPHLAFVKTNRARSKIAHWFKLQDRDQNLEAGKNILTREFKRLDMNSIDWLTLAKNCHYSSVEQLYVALGAGDIRLNWLLNQAQSLQEVLSNEHSNNIPVTSPNQNHHESEVYIHGVGNLMTQLAKCCHPIPGDHIVGYITHGRGVSIHLQDCPKVLQLFSQESQRRIEVSWREKSVKTYPIDIHITAYDREGLLSDITQLLVSERINVTAVNTQSHKSNHQADMQLRLEVPSLEALSKLLSRINQLPNIISANRVHAH